MSYWKMRIKDWIRRKREGLIIWLAWKIPRRLTYWCAIRVTAEASQTLSDVEMPKITAMDALQAWDAQVDVG